MSPFTNKKTKPKIFFKTKLVFKGKHLGVKTIKTGKDSHKSHDNG